MRSPTTGRSPWSGFSKLKAQIDKQVAAQIAEDEAEPMAPWTMHDLRRSLVTGMNDRGLAQPHVIEAIVNHISGHRGGIAGIYNRAVYMEERRKALEAWAKLITHPASGSNVVWIVTFGAHLYGSYTSFPPASMLNPIRAMHGMPNPTQWKLIPL